MVIEKNKKEFAVNDQVLSMDFGVGVIQAIEKIQTDGDDYYVIEHGTKRSKDYFPTKNNRTIRSISSRALFEKAIESLKIKKVAAKFDSKKDRQNYFERRIDKSDVNEIITRLTQLICIEELAVREQRIVDKLVETLELEASIVYNVTKAESKKLISKLFI